MKRNLLFIFILLGAVASLVACATPLTYSAKEIHGQVVDAETGQPIEGVVVVAQWILFQVGSGHGPRLQIIETVTDKDGKYAFSAWGPKPHAPFTELVDRDPEILIFKSGYEPRGLVNITARDDAVRISDWDGKAVKLKKPQGDLESYAKKILYIISTSLPESGKEWKSFPRMVLALDAENRRLKSLGLKPGYRATSFEIENFDAADRAYLRKYEK